MEIDRETLLSLGYDNEYLNHIEMVGGEEKRVFEEEVVTKLRDKRVLVACIGELADWIYHFKKYWVPDKTIEKVVYHLEQAIKYLKRG